MILIEKKKQPIVLTKDRNGGHIFAILQGHGRSTESSLVPSVICILRCLMCTVVVLLFAERAQWSL